MIWTAAECMEIGILAGGTKNIIKITSCFTRVHIQLRSQEKFEEASLTRLKKIPGVRGLLLRGNEIQLITGTEAKKLAEECRRHLGLSSEGQG